MTARRAAGAGWWARGLSARDEPALARLARAPLSALAAPYAAGARLLALRHQGIDPRVALLLPGPRQRPFQIEPQHRVGCDWRPLLSRPRGINHR